MALLCKALKFRALYEQLTPTENKLFINNVMDANGTVISAALFHLILSSYKYKDIDADRLNNMVSDIIQLRKEKQEKIVTKDINGLPSALIGHTASFLPQSDYINLSACTRSLFIGCNTPNQMQELFLLRRKWKCYPIIDLSQFPSIKRLFIHLHQFEKVLPRLPRRDPIVTTSVCRELTAIDLNGQRLTNEEIETFTEQEYINMDNVTDLTLVSFGTQSNPFNVETFQSLASDVTFHNILQCFSLYSIYCHFDTEVTEQIKQSFPSLVGLSIIGGFESSRIALIHEFANQLKYLYFSQYKNCNYNFSSVQFDTLEQLKVVRPSFETMHDILNTAGKLRYCVMHLTYNKKVYMDLKQIKQCMLELITSCESLEYVSVYCTNVKKEWFTAICEGIEYGLFATKKRMRDQLRLKILFESNEPIMTHEIVFMVARVVAVIQQSAINDYMFIVSIRQKGVGTPESMLPQLIESVPGDSVFRRQHIVMDLVDQEADCICITNKQCKINGYAVQWMKNESKSIIDRD
eukprot:143204_1